MPAAEKMCLTLEFCSNRALDSDDVCSPASRLFQIAGLDLMLRNHVGHMALTEVLNVGSCPSYDECPIDSRPQLIPPAVDRGDGYADVRYYTTVLGRAGT